MAKARVPYSEYQKTIEVASAVAETIQTPGWKILEADLLKELNKIQELLVQNRLRTVQQSVTQNGVTKTFTTTAETQIAENAGMFKMGRWILDDIEMKLEAPDRLIKREREGLLIIDHATTSDTPFIPEIVTAPSLILKTKKKIAQLLKKGGFNI